MKVSTATSLESDLAPAPGAGLSPRVVERLTHGPLATGVARFGLPLAVGMMLYTVFNLVDMFMIAQLENGTAALAALAITDMVAAVASIVSTGISTAAVAVVSRRLGAGDGPGVAHAILQSLWLVVAMSMGFGAVGLFGSEAVVRGLMQAKGETASLAADYLQISLGGCVSIFLLLQVTALLRALGHAKTSATLLVVGNLFNVLLNAVFIYGPGPHPPGLDFAAPLAEALGIPRMGMLGAAWATLVTRVVPAAIGLALLWRHVAASLPPIWGVDTQEIRRLLAIGWPSSAQLVIRVGTILVFISLINANFTSHVDQSALTAYGICLRLETMALFVGMGWGAAASTYVGVNLGAGYPERAKRAGWLAATYNVALMLVLVGVYLLFTPEIVGFFDDSPAVIGIGQEYIRVVGLSYLALGFGLVLAQAMAGAGATLSVMVIDVSVLVGIVIPLAIVAAETWQAPRQALWWIIALGNLLGPLGSALWYARGGFLAKRLA